MKFETDIGVAIKQYHLERMKKKNGKLQNISLLHDKRNEGVSYSCSRLEGACRCYHVLGEGHTNMLRHDPSDYAG